MGKNGHRPEQAYHHHRYHRSSSDKVNDFADSAKSKQGIHESQCRGWRQKEEKVDVDIFSCPFHHHHHHVHFLFLFKPTRVTFKLIFFLLSLVILFLSRPITQIKRIPVFAGESWKLFFKKDIQIDKKSAHSYVNPLM